MRSLTLWRDGHGYISCSVDSFDLSPIFVTVTAARTLIQKGVLVDLPDGYTVDTLDMLAWSTGAYGQPMRVSDRQAREIAQIARTLVSQHADDIAPNAREGIDQMIQTVVTEEP